MMGNHVLRHSPALHQLGHEVHVAIDPGDCGARASAEEICGIRHREAMKACEVLARLIIILGLMICVFSMMT
jgi:hypothetical protein